MMRYLITGATGAVGSALVRQLTDEKAQVRAFVRDVDKLRRLLPDTQAEVVAGDALSPADVRQAVEDVDVVFHCVNFPLTDYARTLDAARLLVEAVRPAEPHVVFPGNAWVFSEPAQLPITPETSFNPPSPAARIKAQVDEMLMHAGLPATVVHLPDFYGPRVDNPLITPLFEKALAGENTTFPGPVDVPHQFIYIDDAARALIAVAGQEECYGERYTAGGMEAITVRRFAELIYQAAGTEGRVRGMPLWLLRLLGLVNAEARAGAQVMHTFAQDLSMDGTDIRRDAGFVPEVGYEEGVHRTLAWFRGQVLE